MTSMTAGASTPFTVRDLEEMPDDGRRYELVDGELLVSPAPGLRHQAMTKYLTQLLEAACPEEFFVLNAPFPVRTDLHNELQPDVLVARFEDLTEKNLPTAPVLAVEVLSPSSRLVDLNLKRAAYERMGAASYWVLDPLVPSLQAFELGSNGGYAEVAAVAGGQAWEANRPFPVRVVAVELLGRLG